MPDRTATLQAFGFSIPVNRAGRRLWPSRFKQFVLERMDAGEISLQQVINTCQVSRSYLYQWRMQAKGKPVTAADWRAKARFCEVVVQEEASLAPQASPPAAITISRGFASITLPVDYPIDRLIRILQALEGAE